ncbi:MAG: hypothetical protein COB67_00210 [SAR324 cluster bacterium]|uniref:Uncharacterized protein n=1 Tax=SAR324 cluster bacterium TaxID=2024889 RepID=A0A2A4TBK5_9DELT|nr:MAG: hypothetical protein COB67_00210 [SAR324 cluster bacterium]
MESNNYGSGSGNWKNSSDNSRGMKEKDSFHHWDEKNKWEGGQKGERGPRSKYFIWTQLQEAQDRLHGLYSEMTDFLEFNVATITESEFRDAPIRLIWTATSAIFLFIMGYILVTGLLVMDIPFIVVTPIYFFYWSLTLVFPLYVIHDGRKWVSGKKRTGRYFKQISNTWKGVTVSNLLLLILFYLLSIFDFTELQYFLDEYGSIGSEYINELDISFLQYGMQVSLLFISSFYPLYFFLSWLMKRRSMKIQQENILKVREQLLPTGDVVGEMMRRKI